MKASKKFLSVLLALAMCFSFAAVSAGAEGFVIVGSQEPSDGQVPDAQADISVLPQGGLDDAPGAMLPTEPADPTEPEGQPSEPKAETVAVIKGTNEVYEYSSLDEAIAAAAQNATVTLSKDITLSAPLVIGKIVKIDLGGHTVVFATKSAAYDSAVVVDDGAAVTLKNGEISLVESSDSEGKVYGFKSGLSAVDGALTLIDLELNGSAINGSSAMLSCAEDGSINVIGGEFDFDPSAFVADGYTAQENDGVFTVVESNPVAPISDDPEEDDPDAETPGEGDPSQGEPDPQDGDTLQSKIDADDTGTVTLTADVTEDITIDKDITLDLGTKILTGKITINAGKTVTIKNGTVTGSIENAGKLTAEALTVSGGVTCAENSEFVNNTTANKIDVTTPEGYELKDGKVTAVSAEPAGTASVKDADGNAYNDSNNYLQYLKGVTWLSSYDGVLFDEESEFALEGTLSAVKFNGGTLVKDTDYKLDDATNTLTFIFKQDGNIVIADAFEAASAGKNEITFAFANGDEVKVPVFIWPSVEIPSEKYVIGSNTDFIVNVSDLPDSVGFSNSSSESGTAVAAENYTYSNGELAIKSAYMDKLAAGDRYLGLWYDGMGLMYKIIVRPAPTITPVEANKDNKWLNSSSALSYTVSPNVESVTVDNNAVDAKNYSVSKENVLSLNSAYLKSLSYGDHTLAVVTEDGTVSVNFTTAPSVVAKNGSNHTKGGSKDLSFVASDAMKEVYVGQTKLKTDYYTISSDGKTITLKASFLNTLKADTTYTITVNGDSGHAATTFRILSPESAAANPKTGDSGITLWVTLLILSGAAVAVIIPKRREN